jgi:peptide/nickel transport system permease protein
MVKYIVRRVLYMIPTLILISMISFAIIQLPPGDFLTTLVAQVSAQGESVDRTQLAALEARYALDQPFYIQYFTWISNIILHGDFGESFE